MAVGERLRRLRQEQGLSQRALSSKSGVGRTYIVQVESGSIASPSGAKLAALASALGVPIERFYGLPTEEEIVRDFTDYEEMRGAPIAKQIASEVVKQLRQPEDDVPRFLPAIDPEHDPRLRRT